MSEPVTGSVHGIEYIIDAKVYNKNPSVEAEVQKAIQDYVNREMEGNKQ